MCVVPLGGFLFEYFMWTSSGYAVFRKFQSSVAVEGHEQSLSLQEQQEFMQGAGSKFAGWLLLHLGNIGSNGRDQLFYLTLVAHYHGLSRNGIDLMSRFGYTTNLNRFDNKRKLCLLTSQTTSRLSSSCLFECFLLIHSVFLFGYQEKNISFA